MARSLALFVFAGVVAAQTTVDIFLPMADAQALDASIVGSDASLTTYKVTCPTTAPADECGMPLEGLTVSQGPSSWAMTYGMDDVDGVYTQAVACKLDLEKDAASCSMTASQEYDGTTSTTSDATVETGVLASFIPVTITAGDVAAAPASTTTGPRTSNDSGNTASETSTLATQTSSSDSSEDATSTPSPTDNAAGPMATKNVVLAGVAALVGGVMML
ncbi:hypothetical protein HJFPF1_03178 [Paramyrothecium foliicola]|nr:hypothetical protein HJFPF1_03178 [Paramyrothecium foliicola]